MLWNRENRSAHNALSSVDLNENNLRVTFAGHLESLESIQISSPDGMILQDSISKGVGFSSTCVWFNSSVAYVIIR